MWNILDEAKEIGEKIEEAAEKMEPKTPEERGEEIIEEAMGTDDSGGLLKVMTYRKLYSADRNHFMIEKIAYSEYLHSGRRVD